MSDEHQEPSVDGRPPGPPPLPADWFKMSGEEKYNYLSAAWASTEGKPFISSETEACYQRRARRWLDVVALKKPDRVPAYFLNGEYALAYGGCRPADRFYDQQKAAEAVYKFHQDFDCIYSAIGMPSSGKALDLLGFQLARWPGSRSTPYPENMQFQYVEKEYMQDEAYDELIADPTGYALFQYVPRICNGLNGLAMGLNPYSLCELGGVMPFLMSLAKGPLRLAFDRLLQAADQTFEDMMAFLPVGHRIQSQLGAPTIYGGSSKAPFDILGDTMRGTQNMMLDMFRRPDKVAAACEALISTSIKMAVQSAMFLRIPFVTLWLHKGADGFMSNAQFEKFYWPSLKSALLGMIDAGVVPLLFVQGSYNQRLDTIASSGLPAGKTIWLFDRTDMQMVKEKLGGMACFGGNVPASLFSTGTAEMMEDYCKNVMASVGADGGFFLSPGAAINEAKPENVQAYFDSVKKFGNY